MRSSFEAGALEAVLVLVKLIEVIDKLVREVIILGWFGVRRI